MADFDPREQPHHADAGKSLADRPWKGPTYYGREQLKAAPFNKVLVGTYIFLSGLSGAAALISAIVNRVRGPEARATVRHGRLLSLLAPSIGAGLLIADLHTPKRFYNMLRVAKATSPMSVGSWILVAFSALTGATAIAEVSGRKPRRLAWLRRTARISEVPAAAAGIGLSTYTAALLSATSNPLWAAAPRALAARFGSSAMASGAAALSLMERRPRTRRRLDALAVTALSAELAATLCSHQAYRHRGVDGALEGGWGQLETFGTTGLGVALPLVLYALSPSEPRHRLSRIASWATLLGSAALRIGVLAQGARAAARPDVSFRFSQPSNLQAGNL
jgi:protein NrfD